MDATQARSIEPGMPHLLTVGVSYSTFEAIAETFGSVIGKAIRREDLKWNPGHRIQLQAKKTDHSK